MKLWGLTGGIASGKSTVAALLREQGVPVLDADRLYHELIAPNLSKPSALTQTIIDTFGSHLLRADGTLDRQSLSSLIFRDENAKRALENLTHPSIRHAAEKAKQTLAKDGCSLAFYDVPLLFEKNLEADFNGVLVVWVPRAHQISRLMQRNHLSESESIKRIESQLSLDYKRSRATLFIDNQGPQASLGHKVREILIKITSSSLI